MQQQHLTVTQIGVELFMLKMDKTLVLLEVVLVLLAPIGAAGRRTAPPPNLG